MLLFRYADSGSRPLIVELKAGDLEVKLKPDCCGRMFERPTPSMHHLSRTLRWEGNAAILTLPSLLLSSKNT